MLIFDGRQSVQVRCMSGCEPKDIIAVLKSRGLWQGDERQDPHSLKVSASVSCETQKRNAELRMRELARGIFDYAMPIEGTLAQRYFEGRDLWSVARMIDDIRFNPGCPRGQQFRQPAVVVAMRNFQSNAVVAVQRIFLNREAKKDGAPMMLGSAGGAAMQLQRLQDGKLHVAEGLETALAVIAMDHGPVWALGSTSLIKSFPVLDGVNDLTIWTDRDPVDPKTGKRPGESAADTCQQRWHGAGRETRQWVPLRDGWDAADVWSDRVARQ
jgi:hypothetical protein